MGKRDPVPRPTALRVLKGDRLDRINQAEPVVPEHDPWDEENWIHANPALGQFLSIRALRQEAQEAQNDPSKENAFRQFRLNQWMQQAHRWMPVHLYRRCAGTVAPVPDWLRAELPD